MMTHDDSRMSGQAGDRAVVLGASMAGLLAARVLADAYGQVTVIDRDQLPETSAQRRGVPQGHHLHALLARGQQALEELFGGLTAALVAQGVPVGDMLANARLWLSGYRLRQAHTWLVLLCASRPLLEGYVRARVRALPNVAVLDSRDIVGLAATPDGRRVTGARVHRRDGGARSLRFPDIYETIRDAEPLDDPVAFRFPASVRHRYERLTRFPDGLLVLGDAVSSFNPIYGQGITVAALQALALRRHLDRGVRPQPRRIFADLARVVDVPWDIAAGGDLVFPGVPGRRGPKVRLVSAYLARLHAAATHDAALASAFVRVVGMVAPPRSLLGPGVAARVLRGQRSPMP
jgi:2-polyprenyl-6-methoxyphenol hydroxylase-like FAD-dependent oxidoreductase